MKLDFRPSKVAYIDYEVQSEFDLTKGGAHRYARHPSTRVLTCVVKVDGEYVRLGPYLGQDELRLLAAVAKRYTLVAHNAAFDAQIHEATLGLPEATWCDTLPMARARGLPGGIDQIGQMVFGRGKDPNGKRLIEMLCIIRGGRVPAVGAAHHLLLDYNQRDVELLEQVYDYVKGFGEPDVMTVDRAINDRGVPVHRPFLERLSELYAENGGEQGDVFDAIAPGVNPGSPKQVVAWLQSKGFTPPNDSINKDNWKVLAQDPESRYDGDAPSEWQAAWEVVRDAIQARSELVRVGGGKVAAARAALDDDDRLRDLLPYYAAHTGRWSSRRLQLHNLPQPITGVDTLTWSLSDPTLASAKAIAENAVANNRTGLRVSVSDVLNSAIRHIVRAPLCVADYAQVEARGTAWVSGCERMLAIFWDPSTNVYSDMGSKLFGRSITKEDVNEYAFSKALVLGCTYGMSGKKFGAMCRLRDINIGVLEEHGTTVEECVRTFRETYHEIPTVWKAFGEAALAATNGCPCEAGRCKFYMVGSDLHMELPSGRPIVYRNALVEPTVPAYCAMYGMPPIPVPTVRYDSPRGFRGFLYGSKVCENAVQAICRDFLAMSLVRMEQAGFRPCLHVHDEGAGEASTSRLRELCILMSDPPPWADGFPLTVDGYAGDIWTKQTDRFAGCLAMCGRVVKYKEPK